MTPIVAGLIGLLVGLAVGIGVAMVVRRSGTADPADDLGVIGPVVPEGVTEVVTSLPSAVALIGPHDEVLQSTPPARALGIVRGSRVAVHDILTMVRDSRRDQTVVNADLELHRTPRTDASPALYLSVRVAPLRDGMVLVICDDTTAARRVEETRRDFVINVSHELKTPIGAISLLAEAVEAAADEPEAVRRFSRRMHIESERLTVLVAQIIQLSRVQADEPLAGAELVEIDEVLAGALDRCKVDADRHRVTLTIAGERGCEVLGDAAQLETAIGNLVENAVVYSEVGARVVVAAHVIHASQDADADADWIEITVSDNGIGIAAADVSRIFERFYRVDYARSRANGGTGLGLSIVKHVAVIHGGTVDAWSQPGHGSTFSIRIPARPAARPGSADRPPHELAVVEPDDYQSQEVL